MNKLNDFLVYSNNCWIRKLNRYIKIIKSIEEYGFAEIDDGDIKYIFTRSSKINGWQKTCLINGKPVSDDTDEDYFELLKRHC